jgi:hypothetical protein
MKINFMNAASTSRTSVDYINSLEYNYIETYSLQRGIEFEMDFKARLAEYEEFQSGIGKAGLAAEEEEKFDQLRKLSDNTQYLVDEAGSFHPFSQKTNTFNKDDREAMKLTSILQTEVLNRYYWMCAPIYRDAVIFRKNNGDIVSVLNICLSCDNMIVDGKDISGDEKTYGSLRRFFTWIGHRVEAN